MSHNLDSSFDKDVNTLINGLSGVNKLLELSMSSKLFGLTEYVSIKGEVYKE